jgi:CO/xanthine dehydrogenase FAD-binding subunit
MKPPPLRYERAESVDGALARLGELGEDAKVLAGGQSLVPLLNLRLTRPDVVLDVSRLQQLSWIRVEDGRLTIGALTRQAEAEHDAQVAGSWPLLAEALRWVAHPAIRGRGTIGGSIAHGDPAAELPVVLCALGGSVTARSRRGERTVAASDFFRGFLQTALEPDELLTSIALPAPDDDAGFAFEEFARRPGDFAIVSVAAEVRRRGGEVRGARIAIGGAGPAPVSVELNGQVSGASAADAAATAAEVAADSLEPVGDVHGSAEYRRALTRELVKRAVLRAADSRRADGAA